MSSQFPWFNKAMCLMPQRPVVLLTNCWLCLGNKSDREAVTRLCDVIWDMGDVCTTVSWTLAVMGTRGYFCLVYEDEAFMMSFLSHTGGAALKPNTMCSIYRQRCVFSGKHSKYVGDKPWPSSRDAAQLTSFHRVIKTTKRILWDILWQTWSNSGDADRDKNILLPKEFTQSHQQCLCISCHCQRGETEVDFHKPKFASSLVYSHLCPARLPCLMLPPGHPWPSVPHADDWEWLQCNMDAPVWKTHSWGDPDLPLVPVCGHLLHWRHAVLLLRGLCLRVARQVGTSSF